MSAQDQAWQASLFLSSPAAQSRCDGGVESARVSTQVQIVLLTSDVNCVCARRCAGARRVRASCRAFNTLQWRKMETVYGNSSSQTPTQLTQRSSIVSASLQESAEQWGCSFHRRGDGAVNFLSVCVYVCLCLCVCVRVCVVCVCVCVWGGGGQGTRTTRAALQWTCRERSCNCRSCGCALVPRGALDSHRALPCRTRTMMTISDAVCVAWIQSCQLA
jgi:hypothetical protein